MKYIPHLLVIPDAHANPDYDNERFDVLGRYIAETRPEVIVQLGDWGCMPSLSHYDKGTKKAEGRRYSDDVAVTRDSVRRFHAPWRRLAGYRPKLFITRGNHEARIDKATNQDPKLYGTLSQRDLGFEDAGWKVMPFEEPLVLAGWTFCHHITPGKARNPASSTQALFKATACSAIVGHKHTLEEAVTTRLDGSRVNSIIAGCFTHLNHREDWNRGNQHQDMNGVLSLYGVENGHYGAKSFLTQEYLRGTY